MEPIVYKPGAYKSPGIYKGAGGIYNGRGVYNGGGAPDYVLPFPDGEPLVYNGKTYRTKKIGDLLLQIDFFDEPVFSYKTNYNTKYYIATKRYDIEALVSSMGWRLALDDDILYIAEQIDIVKEKSGYSYNDLLSTQSTRWSSNYRGDDLTGLGLLPTGYYWGSSLSSSTDKAWYTWGGSHATTGNGAVCFQRWGDGNFNNTSRNWNDSNYLPVVFVKDA